MTNMSQAFSMPQVHVGMLPATYHPEEVRLSFLYEEVYIHVHAP